MIRVLIDGQCDEKLKGIYQTDATEKEIKESQFTGKTIGIRKEKRDGSASKTINYYPFKSYHNNRELSKSYNLRNANATIKILDETPINEIIKDVMYQQDEDIYFNIDNRKFKAYFSSNGRSFDLWVDDEGDFYKKHCSDEISNDVMKKAILNVNTRVLNIIETTNENLRMNDFNDYGVNLSIRNIPQNKSCEPQFICFFNDQKTASKVLSHLYDTMKKEIENTESWFEKNKNKFSIHGYWANR